MKKSFLLLPITLAVLAACSSNSPAPVENADGTLSPGMMQAVDGSSDGGNATWEPQITQSNVPNSMNGPMQQGGNMQGTGAQSDLPTTTTGTTASATDATTTCGTNTPSAGFTGFYHPA